MADDWYDDDFKLINSLRGGGRSSRKPNVMDDFFSAAQGMQQLYANKARMKAYEESREEKKALKNALAGMDMEKPDYGNLIAKAPIFTQRLMATMTAANQEERLKIGQAAENATNYLKMVLPHLKAKPETRPFIARQLKQWGVDDDFIETVLPSAELAATDPQTYANVIDESLYGIRIIQEQNKVNMEKLRQGGMKEKARLDLEKIERKGAIDKTLKEMSIDIAKINKTGKDFEIEDTKGNNYIGKFAPSGEFKINPLPEGMRFREKKPGGGKGDASGAGAIPRAGKLSVDKINKDYEEYVKKYPEKKAEADALREQLLKETK